MKRKSSLMRADGFYALNGVYANPYEDFRLSANQITSYIKDYYQRFDSDFIKIVVDEYHELVAFSNVKILLVRALQKVKRRMFPFGFVHILKIYRKPFCIEMMSEAFHRDLRARKAPIVMMTGGFLSAKK